MEQMVLISRIFTKNRAINTFSRIRSDSRIVVELLSMTKLVTFLAAQDGDVIFGDSS